MQKLYPTVSAGEMKTYQQSIFDRAAQEGPIVVMSRSVPKAVLVTPDEWNKIAQQLEDMEDIIADLESEIAFLKGDNNVETITDFDAFAREILGNERVPT